MKLKILRIEKKYTTLRADLTEMHNIKKYDTIVKKELINLNVKIEDINKILSKYCSMELLTGDIVAIKGYYTNDVYNYYMYIDNIFIPLLLNNTIFYTAENINNLILDFLKALENNNLTFKKTIVKNGNFYNYIIKLTNEIKVVYDTDICKFKIIVNYNREIDDKFIFTIELLNELVNDYN